MNNILKKPLLTISTLSLLLGSVFVWIQNTFYGYLDENNVIQDSLFLPLGMLGVFLGLGGLFFVAIKAVVRSYRSQ